MRGTFKKSTVRLASLTSFAMIVAGCVLPGFTSVYFYALAAAGVFVSFAFLFLPFMKPLVELMLGERLSTLLYGEDIFSYPADSDEPGFVSDDIDAARAAFGAATTLFALGTGLIIRGALGAMEPMLVIVILGALAVVAGGGIMWKYGFEGKVLTGNSDNKKSSTSESSAQLFQEPSPPSAPVPERQENVVTERTIQKFFDDLKTKFPDNSLYGKPGESPPFIYMRVPNEKIPYMPRMLSPYVGDIYYSLEKHSSANVEMQICIKDEYADVFRKVIAQRFGKEVAAAIGAHGGPFAPKETQTEDNAAPNTSPKSSSPPAPKSSMD